MKNTVYIAQYADLERYIQEYSPKNIAFFEVIDRDGTTYCRKLIPNKRRVMQLKDGTELNFLKPSGKITHEDDFFNLPFMKKADMMVMVRDKEYAEEIYVKGKGFEYFGKSLKEVA